MAERTANRVDEVLPQVPVASWVLTLTYRLRYRLAWDHALCCAVLGVHARGPLAFYARSARSHGPRCTCSSTTGFRARYLADQDAAMPGLALGAHPY